jgi:exodeoxyribonuclease V alpha subunit
VENLNRLVEELLTEAGLIDGESMAYPGRPVLVVRNDYNLKLFNGDIGVLLADPQKGLRAWFEGRERDARDFMPLRLPQHETAFAMTVHKSQGSEFERVLLVLPREESPVLTRELVYTGLTRARQHVDLWADADGFAKAVQRRIQRRSGLRERLWGRDKQRAGFASGS